MSVSIPWDLMYDFLGQRGFFYARPHGWGEYVFVKVIGNFDLSIIVNPPIDHELRERHHSFRTHLCRFGTGEVIISLKDTASREYWREHLSRRITALERLIESGKICPKCNGYMDARPSQKNHHQFHWVCRESPSCDGTHVIPIYIQEALAEEVSAQTPI